MMNKHDKQRCDILFEESIKSKYTKIGYTWQLQQFMIFAHIESPYELSKLPSSKLQKILENYLIELKSNTNPNSIPSKFTGIKHFCIMNRKQINWDIIYKMYPSRIKYTGHLPWTNDEIRKMLKHAKNFRTIALIHFLASTGARIGVFDHELIFHHVKYMNNGCMAVKLYAGDVEEYWSFLTPQTVHAFKKYLEYRIARNENIDENSPLFVSNDLKKQMTWKSVRNITTRLVQSAKIERKFNGNRYDVQINHGFRKRFNTILKLNNSINYNIAEKLMGHKNGLDGIYFVPTLDELFNEFKKAIRKLEL